MAEYIIALFLCALVAYGVLKMYQTAKIEVGYKIKVSKFSNDFFKPFQTEQITLKESAYCAHFKRLPGSPYLPDI